MFGAMSEITTSAPLARSPAQVVAGALLGHVAADRLHVVVVEVVDALEVVDADDGPRLSHLLGGDLQPAAGRGAEVDDGVAALEQVRLLVDLFQLVGRPGAVPLLFRLVVVLVLSHIAPS